MSGWLGVVLAVVLAAAYWGWFAWDLHVRYGPMTFGSVRHRRYIAGLQQAAIADADHVRALTALTDDDRAWLTEAGWQEPAHACFVRINRLDVDDLPVSYRRRR